MLLHRNEQQGWTEEQQQWLPDGIRTSQASHILLNFKYTESVNQEVFEQAIGYDSFYRNSQSLRREDMQSFVVSSKTPHQRTLDSLGYGTTKWPGVYRSKVVILQDIPLIVLNKLSNTPYNVFFKMFASRQREKRNAITGIKRWWSKGLPDPLYHFLYGLLRYWLEKKEGLIMETLTAEDFIAQGKEFKEMLVSLIQQGEMQDILIDTPFLKAEQEKWLWQGIQRGKEEEREEGHRAMSNTLHQILTRDFPIKVGEYQEYFDQLTLTELQQLSEVALRAKTLTEFETALDAILREK